MEYIGYLAEVVSLFVLKVLILSGKEKVGGRVRKINFGFGWITLNIYIDCKELSTHPFLEFHPNLHTIKLEPCYFTYVQSPSVRRDIHPGKFTLHRASISAQTDHSIPGTLFTPCGDPCLLQHSFFFSPEPSLLPLGVPRRSQMRMVPPIFVP